MNKVILILVILSFSINLIGQIEDDYPSKEEKGYYKIRKHKEFKPLKKRVILNYKSEYFEIENLVKYNSYVDSQYLTPYQDSVYKIMYNPFNLDSMILLKLEYIGGIEKTQILKHEKNGVIEALIYTSSEFENGYLGESGMWIGFSNNSGQNWNYYYTGIVQKQPLYLKWYSEIPLIIDNDNLQIEGALLRQIGLSGHPGPPPKYELVKDGILVSFDLSIISKDTDNDGLTDILENKLYLNENNPDTDNDGILDNLDLNPRKNLPKTEKTIIYEAILNNQICWDSTGNGKILNVPDQIHYTTDTTETILIVTDNKDLLSVQPINTRIIFVTKKEYKSLKRIYKTEINSMSFSPLFKVDNMKDTYKLSVVFKTSGNIYLIKRTEEGWIIKEIYSWMS